MAKKSGKVWLKEKKWQKTKRPINRLIVQSTGFKYLSVKNISLNAVKCDILCGVVVKDCKQR